MSKVSNNYSSIESEQGRLNRIHVRLNGNYADKHYAARAIQKIKPN